MESSCQYQCQFPICECYVCHSRQISSSIFSISSWIWWVTYSMYSCGLGRASSITLGLIDSKLELWEVEEGSHSWLARTASSNTSLRFMLNDMSPNVPPICLVCELGTYTKYLPQLPASVSTPQRKNFTIIMIKYKHIYYKKLYIWKKISFFIIWFILN
jgi:hypothetical protein